ncbi:hypothetical protein OG21DRAFT_1603599 [Imleria badia]|nr:hypothetical protein OG21DRAFT_1603599 [Imleria badia]
MTNHLLLEFWKAIERKQFGENIAMDQWLELQLNAEDAMQDVHAVDKASRPLPPPVSPNSTCDVCTENYMDEAGLPHTINCGHIFCRTSTTAVPQVDTQLQRLLDAIENITDGDTTVEETEGVIDQCDAYQDSQPDSNPHAPIGLSYLLLSALLEARIKYSELAAARDNIQGRLTMELEAARLQCETLIQVRCNEKETVQRNEEAFRAQYDEMNARWKSKVGCTDECDGYCARGTISSPNDSPTSLNFSSGSTTRVDQQSTWWG